MAEEEQEPPPRLGTYIGKALDVSCPGDHVDYHVILDEGGKCLLQCHPSLGQAKGGQPPWRAECTWEWDGCDELEVTVTIPDATGPRKDREFKIPVGEDGSMTFMKTQCVWDKPPVDEAAETLAALSAKELQAIAAAAGLDTAGCASREDLDLLVERARKNGVDVMKPFTKAKSAPEPAPAKSTPAEPSKPASEVAAPAKQAPVAEAAPKGGYTPTPAPVAETPADDGGVYYTLEQLTEPHLYQKLDGIKSMERETYLADDVFQSVFGVGKAEFAKYPKWKKDNIKKQKGLF